MSSAPPPWKIKAVEPGIAHGGAALSFEEDGYAPILVDQNFVRRHNPKAGDMYVAYKDGYASVSPAKAFEDGYTRI